MADKDTVAAVLREYHSKISTYEGLASTVRALLETILGEEQIQLHSISCRAKSASSLEVKLARPDRDYSLLSDITDLAGVRITTYFADDVDLVSRVIEREFAIDRDNSVDRRVALDPDRFGYVSVHYVAQLDPRRRSLAEYSRYTDTRFEIQVRSILQHAWAEIEHDLGYKLKEGVPRDIRRRFSRLAGLLELADEEFASIRDELVEYRRGLATQIEQRPSAVELNKDSFLAFVESSSLVRTLDSKIAAFSGAKVEGKPVLPERNVAHLKRFGIHTVDDLQRQLSQAPDKILAFAGAWLKGTHHDTLGPGISLFYLGYILIGEATEYEGVLQYLTDYHISDEKKRPDVARRVLETMRIISQTEPTRR